MVQAHLRYAPGQVCQVHSIEPSRRETVVPSAWWLGPVIEMKFELLDSSQVCWGKLDGFEDRLLFQKQEWMKFLADTQGATPVIAALRDASTTVGYFSGLTFQRAGIRILGSPFPGWTTAYMGFNLLPHVPREEALRALTPFAFRDLKCMHVEVSDRFVSDEQGESVGFSSNVCHTLVTDLTGSEQEIFGRMTAACRQCIRKAEKSGVRIEEALGEDFADDYYEQLKEVFRKQGLIPTYGLQRVKQLIHHVLPTGDLLLLRARDSQGECIATGIYVALNKLEAFYWGNASFRQGQHLRPNELLNWYAMRYWKRRGLQVFDWGGADYCRRFKAKFGTEPSSYSRFRKSRFGLVGFLRQQAEGMFNLKQRVIGMVRSPSNNAHR
jgi:hypothetical protein